MPDPTIWASGYQRDELDELGASAPDRRKLKHIGNAVLFSTCWLGLMGGIAAWGLAEQASTGPRLAVACVAALFSAGFVLVFDRMAVHFLDTNKISRRLGVFFATLRILLVVAIGTLVDIQLMPIVMRYELAQHASELRETSERGRFAELSTRYNIDRREREVANGKRELETARTALATIPAPIQADLARANRCFTAAFTMPRHTPAYTRERQRCIAMRRDARNALNAYLSVAQQRLNEVQDQAAGAREAFHKAELDVSTRVEQAATDDARNVTESNPSVFWDLVTTNIGAAIKAVALLVLHLCFDLMPFIAKGMSGRTGVGSRICAQLEADRIDADADQRVAECSAEVRINANEMSAQAAIEALHRPAMRAFMADMAEVQARTAAPFEQAAAALERAVAAHERIKRMRTRSPQLDALKWELLTRAMAESLQAAAVRPQAV